MQLGATLLIVASFVRLTFFARQVQPETPNTQHPTCNIQLEVAG